MMNGHHVEIAMPVNTAPARHYTMQVERLEDTVEEMKLLHAAHWQETEGYRHGLTLDFDYDRVIKQHEQKGGFLLYTLRCNGEMVGNCGVYLSTSVHTKKLIATEDTLFVLEGHRGRHSIDFINFVDDDLQQRGITELTMTVKIVNNVWRYVKRRGAVPVAMQLVKVYPNVRT